MNLSTSIITRVTLPAATRPPESDAVTVNVMRRPSILSSVASTTTSAPTGCRLQMVDLDAHPDRRLAVIEHAAQGVDGGLLEECHETGRAEHVDIARSEGDGGVGVADHQPGLSSESDRCVHGSAR